MGSGGAPYAEVAVPVGRLIARLGCHLLTGGGSGVMTETSRAFVESRPRSGMCIGVIKAVEIATRPGYAPGRANPWVEIPIYTHLHQSGIDGTDSLSRNHINVLSSDALVALPGSAGTRSEVELRVGYGHQVILFLGTGKIDGLNAEEIRRQSNDPDLIHIAKSLAELESQLRSVLGLRSSQVPPSKPPIAPARTEPKQVQVAGADPHEPPPPPVPWDPFSSIYELPNINGKNVLVVGIGGGSDIISAYAVSQLLASGFPKTLVWGNTKRGIDRGLKRISRHIYKVPPRVRTLSQGEQTHGTTRIDRSVPRGDRGCPLVFRLSSQLARRMELTTEIDLMKFDHIFAVDTGAYSLLLERESSHNRRDRKMLAVLQRCHAPLHQMTLGPGCVGETTFDVLRDNLSRLAASGQYLGCFPLKPFVDIFRTLGAPLKPVRTPNVLLAIHEGRVEAGAQPGYIVVPRARRPEFPASWLLHGFVFQPRQP